MNYLKVILWGQEIGRLSINPTNNRCYFVFNPNIKDRYDVSPILLSKAHWNDTTPIYGDDRPKYQNLPPFIADSLPDSWGNTVFERWAKDNKIPRNKISPLYKLMFIGKRGMGALEYEPAINSFDNIRNVDLKSLYDLSIQVLEDRKIINIQQSDLTMQSLLAVGTSAGGRQMKAIIAIDKNTGRICSGQTDTLSDFDYYILKFGNPQMPTSEIEMAYYNMAIAAGITMEHCEIKEIEGIKHFLTKRFDRANGKKLHVQTLAAIYPDASSYEDLFAVCRVLKISESEVEEVFRRLVFNVIANNTDDHNKNTSFIMNESGTWHLAPAYDVTFIFNNIGNGAMERRCLSLCGKFDNIDIADLHNIAAECDIRNAAKIISDVALAIAKFPKYAKQYGISYRWSSIVWTQLKKHLIDFDLATSSDFCDLSQFIDARGRHFKNFDMSVNAKGHFELTTEIDGTINHRFIRQNMPLYDKINHVDLESKMIQQYVIEAFN